MLLPEPYRAKAGLTWLTDDLRAGLPVVQVAVALALKILFFFANGMMRSWSRVKAERGDVRDIAY